MIYVTALVLLGIMAAVGLVWWELNQLSGTLQRSTAEVTDVACRERVRQVEELVDMLPVKWEQMVKQSERAYTRARSVIRSTQKKLADAGLEDPAIEAEGEELQRIDDERGSEPELRLMPGPMEEAAQPVGPGPEDWEALTWAKKYGG